MSKSISSQQISELEQKALAARSLSYCPYSNFRVGCAILLDTGEIVEGANVENASYGATICAERSAIIRAVMQGHRKFKAIAVSSDNAEPVSPCGICRQFISEFGTDILVIMVSPNGKTVKHTLGELLPLSFGPENLQ